MSDPFNNAGIFLVSTLFDLYLFILVIRLVLVWVRADYFNPLSQFIVKVTNRLITPLRRFIPNIANLELSTLLCILVLEALKFFLIGLMTTGLPNAAGLIILALADTLKIILNTFFYAILIQTLLSWLQPGYSPMTQILMKITSPVLRPIQRLIPNVAGFDISPIPALIGLQVLTILLVSPLFGLGLKIAFS
jgi:YggT family protein